MKQILLIALVCATAGVARAQLTTNSTSATPAVSVGSPAAIPDGNPVGLTETFNVSGVAGSIYNIQVSLDISGGFNGDLYAYLVGPQGQLAVLLNRVGVTGIIAYGYSDAGMNITLDGLTSPVTSNIHDYQTTPGYSLVNTVWAADGRKVNPQAAGGTLYGTSTGDGLNLFLGTTGANGTWTLFLADLASGGGTANLQGAILNIMTIPEPQTWIVLGGGLAVLISLRHKRK